VNPFPELQGGLVKPFSVHVKKTDFANLKLNILQESSGKEGGGPPPPSNPFTGPTSRGG